MILRLISWLANGPWWHWLVAYLVGYVAFVTLAILIWGFVYRPKMAASQYVNNTPWTGEEIVTFALIQGLLWPIFTVGYLSIGVVVGALEGSIMGGSKLAAMLSQGIPDRPPGFQVRK